MQLGLLRFAKVSLAKVERSTARSFPGPRWASWKASGVLNVYSFLAFAPSSGGPRFLLYTTKAALDRSSNEGSAKLTLSVCSNAGSAVGGRELLMEALKKPSEEWRRNGSHR
jgi:hypothetical protein